MEKELFIPSSPEQAQRVIDHLEALTLREFGEAGALGQDYPKIPRSSMPKFITDRFLILNLDLQQPTTEGDSVSPFLELDAAGDFYHPLAGISFSRETTFLHAQSFTEVTYCVFQRPNEAKKQNELALSVATILDISSFSEGDSPENQSNQPLRSIEEFRQQSIDNPFGLEREMEAIFDTPSVADLMLTEEQKKLQIPSDVSYQEADLLIGFLNGLYR